MREPVRDAAERAESAAGGVEERKRVHVGVARREAAQPEAQPRVVRQSAVVQQRALRKARGAGRVLDLDRIVGLDVGQLLGRRTRVQEGIELRKRDRLAQAGQLAAHTRERLRHRVAPELGQQDDPRRARLLEDIGQLAGPVGGVDRHEGHAGQRGAELDDHPLRDVRRPHGHPFTGLEAPEERAGAALGVVEQLAVRPAAALLRVRVPGDQRWDVGSGLRSVAQDPPDRRVEDPFALVRGVVRLAESRCRDGHPRQPAGVGASLSVCQSPKSFPCGSLQTANQPMPGTGIFSPDSPPSSFTLAMPASISSTSK